MKVVLFLRSLNYGGAERQVVALARGADPARCQMSVVSFYGDGLLQPELEKAAIPVVVVGKTGRWDILHFFQRLIRIMRQSSPNVLYSFLPVPNAVAVLLKVWFPKLKVVLGVRTSGKDYRRYDWTYRLSFVLERRLSVFADRIVVNSLAGETNLIRQGYPAKKIVVVHNGIDTRACYPDRQAGGVMRSQWGIPTDAQVVGLVGRLDPMKGHDLFLKSAEILIQQFPRIHFVMVGDGSASYRAEMEGLAESLGLNRHLTWVRGQEEMRAVYNAFDLLCMASLFGEGFPNAVGEAMACAVPCAVTAVGDAGVLVGDCGRVVPPGDAQELAQAISSLITLSPTERQALGNKARSRIVDNFSVENMVAATLSVLEEACQKTTRPS